MDKKDYQIQLETVNSWIRAADQKISVFVAIWLGYLTLTGSSIIEAIDTTFVNENLIVATLVSIWCALQIMIFKHLSQAISPVVKNKNDSMLFFGNIAMKNLKNYQRSAKSLSLSNYKNNLIEQIHTNSVICSIKHSKFKNLVIILIVSVFIHFVLSLLNMVLA